MKTKNHVCLIGRAGGDPIVKYTQSGVAILTVSVATNYKDKQGNERVDWHNCKAFDKTAELMKDLVRKGSLLNIEGSIRMGEYERDGVKIRTTEIAVQDFIILSRPEEPAVAAAVAAPSGTPQVPFDDDEFGF